MEEDAFNSFLQETYYSSLEHFTNRAAYHQRVYNWLQWSIIILSGVNAFLIGLQSFFSPIEVKVATFAISVIISILAGAFKTFNFQEKWAAYQKLIKNLKNEYDFYTNRIGDYSQNDHRESLFVTRIWTIINEGTSNLPNATIQGISKNYRRRQLLKLQERQNEKTKQSESS